MIHFTKKALRSFWKRKHNIVYLSISFFIFLGIFSYITNPFTKYNIVDKNRIVVNAEHENFDVKINDKIYLRKGFIYNEIATLKSGWHILVNRLDPRIKLSGTTLQEIIVNTHLNRFGSQEPFLISGEHFSVLYPRSIGIFYHTLLDSRTALNETDWRNKEVIYLKTVALLLAVYNESDTLSTTIVPIWKNSVTLINIYSPPSDTLYSLLYGLQALMEDTNESIYPFIVGNSYKRNTVIAAQKLLHDYNASLQRHVIHYFNSVYDPQTGLVRTDIYLSGTKDSVKRSGAFYDNVIFWKTMQLAQQFGLQEPGVISLEDLKTRIIKTYWLNDGYFLEELSPDAVQHKWYSSDWLIAYQTGFLDPNNANDRQILIQAANYVIKNKIDEPFGMRYQMEVRPKQLHTAVRFFAREYGSTAIWSHWGMEWIKLLIHLAQVTGDKKYLQRANKQLTAYKHNIEKYGGFPEVYMTDGNIFKTKFYRGIRSTGWIVNYEQAVAMYNWTEKNWNQFEK